MTNFYYSMIGASYAGIEKHPQQDMRDRGFNVIKSVCFPVGDCWYFRVDNENDISDIPNYLERRDDFTFPDERPRNEMQKHTENCDISTKEMLRHFEGEDITAVFKFNGEEVFRTTINKHNKECDS